MSDPNVPTPWRVDANHHQVYRYVPAPVTRARVMVRIDEHAVALRATPEGKSLTHEQAVALVLERYPSLYANYCESPPEAPDEPRATLKMSAAELAIDFAARERQARDPTLTYEAAVDLVLREEPGLYPAYEREREIGVARVKRDRP